MKKTALYIGFALISSTLVGCSSTQKSPSTYFTNAANQITANTAINSGIIPKKITDMTSTIKDKAPLVYTNASEKMKSLTEEAAHKLDGKFSSIFN